HDALGVQIAALASDAADQLPVGHAGRDEDGVVALDQVVGLVDLVHLESGVDAALTLLVVARPEDALDVTTERLDRAGGDDALRAAAHAAAHVGARTVTCGVDPTGDVAVAHQTRAGTGVADVLDQLLVPRPVQDRDHHLVDRLVQRPCEAADVLGDGKT